MKLNYKHIILAAILIGTQLLFAKNEIALSDSLPPDFPVITVNSSNNPAPGLIFLEHLGITKSLFYLLALDSTGNPYYYYKPPIAGIDFKMQPNGLFSYASPALIGSGHSAGPLMIQNFNVINYLLDSTFKIIDSVQMQNDYLADFHEFVVLPNGHYLMMNYENNYVDMSKVVPNGNANANVIGTVIQELDNNKNCVFQWRSLDHIPITDSHDNLLNASFEHAHGSSMYLDADGNLIVSFVASVEIIKIDMVTGKIIWRLGGLKNQFNIIGDHDEDAPFYFTMQHDVKRLENGNLLFYDNGFNKKTWASRAVEYSLDEQNKTANLVWEYRHTPDIAGYAMGSAQRLPNGNTLINWGLIFQGFYRTVTEVTPDKNIAFELSFPSNAFSYRASKYELPACRPVAEVFNKELTRGNTYKFNKGNEQTGVDIYIEQLNAFFYNIMSVKKYDCTPVNISFNGESPVLVPCRYVINTQNISSFSGEISFDITQLPKRFNPENLKVYYRPSENSGSYSELTTHFDNNNNKLIASITDTGEYVIGFLRTATEIFPPSLLSPVDKQILVNNNPVKMVWSPTGRYDSFKYQVSEDSIFSQTILDLSSIKTPIAINNLDANKTYYWRAKTNYRNLESEWSEVHSFTLTNPMLEIETPNGGEIFTIDTMANVIRWRTNLKDTLSIALYKNGNKQSVIEDSIFSFTNAYSWKIPKTIPVDSDYKIRIKSLRDSNLTAVSANNFTIKLASTDVKDIRINENNEISCYPNPVNNKVSFNINLNKSGHYEINLFDFLGKQIAKIYEGELQPGSNKIEWDAGQLQNGSYFYQLKNETGIISGKMILLR